MIIGLDHDGNETLVGRDGSAELAATMNEWRWRKGENDALAPANAGYVGMPAATGLPGAGLAGFLGAIMPPKCPAQCGCPCPRPIPRPAPAPWSRPSPVPVVIREAPPARPLVSPMAWLTPIRPAQGLSGLGQAASVEPAAREAARLYLAAIDEALATNWRVDYWAANAKAAEVRDGVMREHLAITAERGRQAIDYIVDDVDPETGQRDLADIRNDLAKIANATVTAFEVAHVGKTEDQWQGQLSETERLREEVRRVNEREALELGFVGNLLRGEAGYAFKSLGLPEFGLPEIPWYAKVGALAVAVIAGRRVLIAAKRTVLG